MNLKNTGLILGPTLFIITRYLINFEGLPDEANAVLASALWIATWWITEALPISVTALLPIILFPLTGGLELDDTTSAYGHKLVFFNYGRIHHCNCYRKMEFT